MLYLSLCLLLCSYFVEETIGYITDLGTLPTFSDWAIIPYTIATYGRVLYKEDGKYFFKNTSRNLVPEGEQVEYFKHFLKSSEIYVDKSPFITEVLNDPNRAIRILRPRMWGKTLNLNMLEKFLEIEVDEKGNPVDEKFKRNPELFCGAGSKQLKVCNDKESMNVFGKHPVLSISLKGIRGNSYKEIELGIRERLTTAFQKHYYLKRYLNDNETLLPFVAMKDRLLSLMEGDPHTIDMLCSIQFVSELLYNHHGNSTRVYLLIDDFDSPIINAFAAFGHNKTEYDELMEFVQGFYSMGVNDNEYLEKVVMTGTYHLYLDDDFAGLTNVTEYNILQDDKYGKYFGFSQQDVEGLLAEKSISTPISQVQQWYNGYKVGGSESVYNPGSVMQFIQNGGKLDQYTVQKVNDPFLTKILASDEAKSVLRKVSTEELLVEGDEADIEIDPPQNYVSKSIVLMCNGILTPTMIDLEKEVLKLKLPNEEVKEFVKKVLA
ncbi:uncharacterized protein in vnfD 5'region-like [Planococcus citri]|uniref:uncharacterized protein in vnfD 5'region-like n=1 Tax=Planococcus citri TaxID=170843 RepID=UPI0031F9834C